MHVGAGLGEQFGSFVGTRAHADRGADPQATELASLQASGCSDDFRMSLTVIRPLQFECLVHHEHALEAVLVHQRFAFLDGRAFVHGHEAFGAGS
jgi:hypothetical protein